MRLGLAKALGAAGVLITTALVGGTLIGSTLALGEGQEDGTTATLEADAGAGAAYCDTFMDALAAELGTTREGLVAAGKAAANAAIDAAVAAGDLSEERAEALRERVAEYDGEGCGWFGRGPFHRGDGPGFARGFVHGFVGANTFEATADALGVTEAELMSSLREEGSLQAVAEAQGADYDTVKAAALEAVEAELAAAVAEGNLEQERADTILERVTTWLDEGGEVRGLRQFRGPGGDGDDSGGSEDSEEEDAS